MESWSYTSEGKSLLFSDEVDLPVDPFGRSRKTLMGWESKPSCNNFDINNACVENLEFMDLGFNDFARKTFLTNPIGGTLDDHEVGINDSTTKGLTTSPTCLVSSNSFFKDEESGSKISSSLVESSSQDSTLIDLKLGRLVDCREKQSGSFLKERSVVSSMQPSLTKKRARTTNSISQIPLCQVYGCNKDLSSCKDYHKRHKVCEVHTKTPRVVVNGKEQRFCQQCSRFHSLGEFDDSKRSCRRRLAGHNERRRKPQFNILSGKSHRFLQSCQGTKFMGSSLPNGASIVFPSLLSSGMPLPERHEETSTYKRPKFEQEPFYSPPLAISLNNRQQYSPLIPPSATQGYTIADEAATVQPSPGISNSSCALSLLSAQSSRSLINNQASHVCHNFGNTLGVEKFATSGMYSSGLSSIGADVVQSEVEANRGFLPQRGSTVDLIQLSSHLKRVEQQRSSMQLKQQNDEFFCSPTT